MFAALAAGAASGLMGGGSSKTNMSRSASTWYQSSFGNDANTMTSYVLIGVVVILLVVFVKGKK